MRTVCPSGEAVAEHTAGAVRVRRVTLVIAVLVAAALACGTHRAAAQGGIKFDNVLYPKPIPIPLYVGIEGGYGRWKDEGYFSVTDGSFSCAMLNSGEGEGVTVGAKAMIYLNTWFFISPRVRYEPRPGTFTAPIAGSPVRDANDSVITLDAEAQVDATFAAGTLDLTIGVEFFQTGIYLFGGGSGSLLLDGFYNYTERLKGPNDIVFGGTQGHESQLVTGRTFATYQRSAFDLRGGGGFLLKIGKLVFNPEVFISRPLTSVLDQPEELKQSGLLGTFSIMYNLGD